MADIPDLIEEEDMDDFPDGIGDDDAWEGCDEESAMKQEAQCLFCSEKQSSPEETFQHCNRIHGFNIVSIQRHFSLDTYDYIKLINYIRSKNVEPSVITNASGELPWNDDDFFKPVVQDDVLLQCDPDDFEEFKLDEGLSANVCNSNVDAEKVTLSQAEFRAMAKRVKDSESQASQLNDQLQLAIEDLNKMKIAAQDLMMNQASTPVSSHEAVQNLKDDEDDVYFGSYGHFGIHEEMLKDKIRTEYYRDCIEKNASLFKDKVVLDVGCGTGILSMFAARAGAKKVIAVDMSDIVYNAIDIVKENGLDGVVTVLRGRMEDVTLPVDKVDIIISEWMGYFLLFESMLDTVLWARDHYLADGGRIVPDFCDIRLAALADPDIRKSHLTFWDDVYGFKMSCMKSHVVREASVVVVKQDCVVSSPCVLKEIDICTCSTKDLEFSSPFTLPVSKDCEVTALVGYFDIKFNNCIEKLMFSTSPSATPTHWKQTVLLMDPPIQCKTGHTIEGTLTCRKNRKDPRSLDIIIKLPGKTYNYSMQ